MPNLAIIGDIHLQFGNADIAYFNQSDYDLVLFTGDLGEFDPREDLTIAARLAKLTKPALFIPGNHDVANYFNVVAEAMEWRWLEWLSGFGRPRNVAKLKDALHPVICGGYSTHAFAVNGLVFDVIAARPFSMGGARVSFPRLINRLHDVTSLDSSITKLQTCVDQSQSDTVIFLAHGGPTGCGDQPTDPWGKDFGDAQGDHGEPDLAAAIGYARERGKRVVAVVAGHMHHTTKQGEPRRWQFADNGTTYINAARVPRSFMLDDKRVRHHIRLTFDADQVLCAEELI